MRRGVAQSGSALEWGSSGRPFKSGRPDHKEDGRWCVAVDHPFIYRHSRFRAWSGCAETNGYKTVRLGRDLKGGFSELRRG